MLREKKNRGFAPYVAKRKTGPIYLNEKEQIFRSRRFWIRGLGILPLKFVLGQWDVRLNGYGRKQKYIYD
jgi:hypothetical protein